MTKHQKIVRQRTEHNISRRDIDPDALKVLYRLIRRGHIAYLVGGGVRDLLLGRSPKDFDVSTDAKPGQLKKMFRNCFLIGRRFRLAHIKYGTKIIETSTFRSNPQNEGEELLQLDDNSFGSPEEDALRRDFTINGLFYDIETFSVIDYVGGLEDLDKKLVRSIGEPDIRFQEDPVRMLRAVRFASRLGFTLEKNTEKAIIDYHQEILKASEPRLLEEIFRLYPFGASEAAFKHLYKTKLMSVIFTEIDQIIRESGDFDGNPLWQYLSALDRGDLIVPEVSNSLMLGALFLPVMLQRIGKSDSGVTRTLLNDEFDNIVEPFLQRIKAPRRLREKLNRIITIQHRFFVKGKKNFSRTRFVAQDWFPEALALYEIHLTASNKDFFRADEWRTLWEERLEIESNNTETEQSTRKSRRRGRRGGRRRNRLDNNQPYNNSESEANAYENFDDDDMPEPENTQAPDSAEQKIIRQPEQSGQIRPAKMQEQSSSDNITVRPTEDAAQDSEEQPKKKRRRRRRKKKKNPDEISSQQDGSQQEVKQNTPSAPQTAEAEAPLNGMDILKKSVANANKPANKKKRRPKNKDKQILHDNRPANVGSSFDQHSQAPHWLDEI